MPGYRVCYVCKQKRRLQAFNWKVKAKNKRHTKCKFCERDYSRVHYQQNKEYYKAKAHFYEKRKRHIERVLQLMATARW